MSRLFLFILLLLSCSEKDLDLCHEDPIPGLITFEFKHTATGSTFLARTSSTVVIEAANAQLNLNEQERNMHINGRIAKDSLKCNFNPGWNWYFIPDQWVLSELSIELCDGDPFYVQENVDEYIRTGGYCPWGSIVNRRLD